MQYIKHNNLKIFTLIFDRGERKNVEKCGTESQIARSLRYFAKNTDENHPMTTGQITGALKNCGIVVTRKTLYDDIETLNRYGFEILCDKSRSNLYYVADRKFERPEVQILLQAVGGAKFLSDKKTTLLSRKVAELLGEAQAERCAKKGLPKQSKQKTYKEGRAPYEAKRSGAPKKDCRSSPSKDV